MVGGNSTSQQQGLNSRGFNGCMLTHQEKRVQRFHELLNDYVNPDVSTDIINSDQLR